MSAPVGKGHTAVRAQKRPRLSDGEPWQRYELFPTPPWATRALAAFVLPALGVMRPLGTVLEPCAGLGHMSEVIKEFASETLASDIHNYQLADGRDGEKLGIFRLDFLDPGAARCGIDWIITNPPFGRAATMLEVALNTAKSGVAFLLRLQWLETGGRYRNVFTRHPPTLFAPFAERVPMCEGGWDPKCSTATGYAWFVWQPDRTGRWMAPASFRGVGAFDGLLIPPVCRDKLTISSDRELATRCVPGFVPPSSLRKSGRQQAQLVYPDDP